MSKHKWDFFLVLFFKFHKLVWQPDDDEKMQCDKSHATPKSSVWVSVARSEFFPYRSHLYGISRKLVTLLELKRLFHAIVWSEIDRSVFALLLLLLPMMIMMMTGEFYVGKFMNLYVFRQFHIITLHLS
jgi:hypothetical protein